MRINQVLRIMIVLILIWAMILAAGYIVTGFKDTSKWPESYRDFTFAALLLSLFSALLIESK